jgi:hypothetical protein
MEILMRYKRSFIFILPLFFILACTKEATIKLPASEEKLVVTCFISPDEDFLSAVVRLSKPKFGAQQGNPAFQDDVQDATVTLSDGNNSFIIPFDPSQSFYFWPDKIEMPIISGKTYYLTVSTPDGKKVSASTTVPHDTLQLESMRVLMRRQDSISFEQDISLVVTDEADRINYVMYHFTNHVETRAQANPNFPAFGGEYSWMQFDTDEKTAHPKYFTSTENLYYSSDTITRASFDVSIINSSREFYLYNKSVSEGAFTSPFADPVMIYTNFDSGFGCFGAYRAIHRHHVIR